MYANDRFFSKLSEEKTKRGHLTPACKRVDDAIEVLKSARAALDAVAGAARRRRPIFVSTTRATTPDEALSDWTIMRSSMTMVFGSSSSTSRTAH